MNLSRGQSLDQIYIFSQKKKEVSLRESELQIPKKPGALKPTHKYSSFFNREHVYAPKKEEKRQVGKGNSIHDTLKTPATHNHAQK